MKKLDIRGELERRKYHVTNRFYYWIYRTLMSFPAMKFHAKYTREVDLKREKGPCFVIFNHLSRIDHNYVMTACYPKRLNMLAGYSEFFRSHLHTVFKMNNVLPKKNYSRDVLGTKAIMSIIKQGGSVTFAPEGLATNDGMNKPIVPGTGGMLKKFGVPVYFCELRGQYLQNTKVCLDVRSGKTFATTKLLFSAEDLKTLTVEEIDQKINEAFRHDEYAWQKEKHIRWKTNGRSCERLDGLLFRCPKCGEYFKMKGEGDKIECLNCGNGATVDDYYDFHPFDGSVIPFETQSEWARWERAQIIKEIRKDQNYRYVERVKIGRLPNDRYMKDLKTSEIVGEGTLTIDHTGMSYEDDADKTLNFFLDYTKLYTLITEVDSSFFNLYVDGEYTDVFPQEHHSAIMITYLVEEMHRLHVNYYKNFPWFDYMYEDEAEGGQGEQTLPVSEK
ncbi:MAG: 1-acyl-sn-glycerol-3-phosphate acyltransferase [Clostridia bacterium]|nr:1-acyl-sn-glycerol-3-phosphate acyltransferase [Clostridia bacterium]